MSTSISDYKLHSIIGRGGLSCVYNAMELKSNRVCALKEIPHIDSYEFVDKEDMLLSKTVSKYVVGCLEVFYVDSIYDRTKYIVTE